MPRSAAGTTRPTGSSGDRSPRSGKPTPTDPATEPDPGWLPLLNTPPYPEHPSGHSCLSGSIVHILQDFFGTDKMEFSATSAVSGTTRSFTRFSQAIKEIIEARVWGGIHFRTADVQGSIIGKKVAHWREKHYFQRHCCIGSPPGLIGETRAHDISPRPSPPPPGAKLGLRRVPLPARGHHPGRPLVPALRPLLPGRRRAPRRARRGGRPRHGVPVGSAVRAGVR